jgi:hypothetical protein
MFSDDRHVATGERVHATSSSSGAMKPLTTSAASVFSSPSITCQHELHRTLDMRPYGRQKSMSNYRENLEKKRE